ncbi:serine/threonine-protein kinase [Aquabacterium sp. OR-4]|uniref:serine/threonine-protein kinase n=1 Tax=Aquabacterium sp. OR-4 TaxID=2978127 RepID=UPI0028C98703|nr:serine/threonine-protein kinase [Aquabacterium sp. OR-4]MDT7837998.1 serine/threonine-protein kinase [Aquabacterium sp. OR-4]
MTEPASPDLARLRELNALLEQGLALAPAERQAWYAQLAEAQRACLSRHHAWIDAEARIETDSFLQAPLPLLAQALAEPASAGAGLRAGDQVGPYLLLEELGRGGHAWVWRAARGDAAPAREVALKLPFLGWSPAMLQRALRERALLASLEHPHIARLYEAGQTEAGLPWLAMELVRGQAIDRHCQAHGSTLAQRLALFVQAAAAVAHAHAQLVVHRDLKPANILVDEAGQVRLLDFGMAKLIAPDAADPAHAGDGSAAGTADAALTRQWGAALTPEYAAPEQARGQAAGVSVDVYALGVVLFELLAGKRPYTLNWQPGQDLATAILQAEVPPASVAAQRARHAGRAVPVPPRLLRGDLDAVLAKALAKDPAQRYASVDLLVADLQRSLAHEPVLARPPGWRYRLGRQLRRHVLGVSVSAAVLLLSLLGGGLSAWQWQRAEAQRQQALALLARGEASHEFMNTVLMDSVDRDHPVTLNQLFEASTRYVEHQPDPLLQATGAFALATWHLNAGRPPQALAILDAALAAPLTGPRAMVQRQLHCLRANALDLSGQPAAADQALQLGLAPGAQDPDVRSHCLLMQAYVDSRRGRAPAVVLRSVVAAIAVLDEAGLPFWRRRALLQGELAHQWGLQKAFAPADAAFHEALGLMRRMGRGETGSAATLISNHGALYAVFGMHRQGLALREQALALLQQRTPGGPVPPTLQINLGGHHQAIGRAAEAAALFGPLADKPELPAVLRRAAQTGLAMCRIDQGALDEAERLLQQAAAGAADTLPQLTLSVSRAWQLARLRLWLARQDWPAAEAASAQLLARRPPSMRQAQAAQPAQPAQPAPTAPTAPTAQPATTAQPPSLEAVPDGFWLELMRLRAEALGPQGRAAEAEQQLREGLALARQAYAATPASAHEGWLWQSLGQRLASDGRQGEAAQAQRRALALLAEALGPDSPHTQRSARALQALPALPASALAAR